VLLCVTVLCRTRALTGARRRSVPLCRLAHRVAPTWLRCCVRVTHRALAMRGRAAGYGERGDELWGLEERAAKGRAQPWGAAPCEAAAINFSCCFSVLRHTFRSPAIRAELQGALLLPPAERRALPEEPGAHP